jgi:hypothetical protein
MLGYNAWKYLSYNAGEDWAVAVPYVYFMKGQRNLFNKWNPGFAYDSDRGLCGASFKMDDHGRITGNYNAIGALDLQTRFTTYNIGTLMFREIYSDIAYRLRNFEKSGYQLSALSRGHVEDPHQPKLSSNPLEALGQWTGQTMKWVMRDVIKGGLYMTPAVPFFWSWRTPQHKYRGVFIHPEHGAISFHNERHGNLEVLHANEPRRTQARFDHTLTHDTPLFYARSETDRFIDPRAIAEGERIGFHPLEDPSHNKPDAQGRFDHKEFQAHQHNYGFFDSMLQHWG